MSYTRSYVKAFRLPNVKLGSYEVRKIGKERSYLPNFALFRHERIRGNQRGLSRVVLLQRVTPRFDVSMNSMKVRTSGRSGTSARAFSAALATVSDERKKIL